MVVYFVWEENDNQQRPEREAEKSRGHGNAATTMFSELLYWIFKTTLL
jgi:hypothetical protein